MFVTPPTMLLTFLESPWLIGAHQGGFLMFRPTFVVVIANWTFLLKTSTKEREIGVSSLYCWKALYEWDCMEVIS
jgi:hypothetical protein